MSELFDQNKPWSCCEGCGRILGDHVTPRGWKVLIPNNLNDPWLCWCSWECVQDWKTNNAISLQKGKTT